MSILTNTEFEYIRTLEKEFIDTTEIDFSIGMKWERELISLGSKDTFIVNYNRASLEIKKITLQGRYRKITILVRFDTYGIHRNPEGTDGLKIEGPHVHVYREGFDDKWAFPLSILGLEGTEPIEDILEAVMKYINIINIPNIKRTLF